MPLKSGEIKANQNLKNGVLKYSLSETVSSSIHERVFGFAFFLMMMPLWQSSSIALLPSSAYTRARLMVE